MPTPSQRLLRVLRVLRGSTSQPPRRNFVAAQNIAHVPSRRSELFGDGADLARTVARRKDVVHDGFRRNPTAL